MLRFPALAVALLSCAAVLSAATTESNSKSQPAATVQGVVADPTGAIIPNAQVNLVDADGSVAGTTISDGIGNFQMTAPHPGIFTLVISEPGFDTVHFPVTVKPNIVTLAAPASHVLAAPLHISCPSQQSPPTSA